MDLSKRRWNSRMHFEALYFSFCLIISSEAWIPTVV